MPNRQVHLPVGVAAGVGVVAVFTQATPEPYRAAELLAGSFGGGFGGCIPDVLEPATHPGHRSLLHRLVAGSAVTAGLLIQAREKFRLAAATCHARAALLPIGSEARQAEERRAAFWYALAGFAMGFAAGYASHLVLDGATPASIPFLARGF